MSTGRDLVSPAANPLDRLAAGVHVGREREVDELCEAGDSALAGRGQLVLVSGDQGIGKTRLLEELTTYAYLRGALVLWGRCYEGEGAPAYWPWMQVISAYSVDHDPDALAEMMGPGAGDIAQSSPKCADGYPVSSRRRHRWGKSKHGSACLTRVSTFLLNAARREPLVVVLDDLHCADRPSLTLLEFLAPSSVTPPAARRHLP